MEENYAVFEEIVGKIWKKSKDSDGVSSGI
jgi:hypothetical protein